MSHIDFEIKVNIGGKEHLKCKRLHGIYGDGLSEESIMALMETLKRTCRELYIDLNYAMRGSDDFANWRKSEGI